MEEDNILLEVINSSLELENHINIVINYIFVVDQPSNTKNFKKNGNLKVQNKVDLFYDFNLIDKNTYTDLCTQLEIRNAFVHNIEIKNFDDYLDYLTDNGTKNKFLKCSDKSNNLEKFRELHKRNFNNVNEILKKDGERIKKYTKLLLDNNQCLLEAVQGLTYNLKELIDILNSNNSKIEEKLYNSLLDLWKVNHLKINEILERKHDLQHEDFIKMVRGSF